jgi:alpha-D-ribose 1-methylphosphonate 5-triphosphate diphosphatase
MSGRPCIIAGGTLVLPESVLQGDLLLRDGRIELLGADLAAQSSYRDYEVIDAHGLYVLPGIIDTHNDEVEKEIAPRPNAHLPLKLAFNELDRKLAGHGVTMIYHSLSLSGGISVRSNEMIEQVIGEFAQLAQQQSMIRHRIHLRYEITNPDGMRIVWQHLKDGSIQLLSFMDHSPGQGQFTAPGTADHYMMKTHGLEGEAVNGVIERMLEQQQRVNWQELQQIAAYATASGIALAAHDSDTVEKVKQAVEWGITISEFPINIETARAARDLGLYVSVGAPNLIRGASLTKNMRAIDAVKEGCVRIICADYYSAGLLPAAFHLEREGVDLPQAVRMVTLNPATALGLAQDYGSLEVGKRADILLVEFDGSQPVVRRTLVGGATVYQAEYDVRD